MGESCPIAVDGEISVIDNDRHRDGEHDDEKNKLKHGLAAFSSHSSILEHLGKQVNGHVAKYWDYQPFRLFSKES